MRKLALVLIIIVIIIVIIFTILSFEKASCEDGEECSHCGDKNSNAYLTDSGLKLVFNNSKNLDIDGEINGFYRGYCISNDGEYKVSDAHIYDGRVHSKVDTSGYVECYFPSSIPVVIDETVKVEGDVRAKIKDCVNVRGCVDANVKNCVDIRGSVRACVNNAVKVKQPVKVVLPRRPRSKEEHHEREIVPLKKIVTPSMPVEPRGIHEWVIRWRSGKNPRLSLFDHECFEIFQNGNHKVITGIRRKLEIRYASLQCRITKPSRIMFDFLVRKGSGVLVDMGSSHVTYNEDDDCIYLEGIDGPIMKQSDRKDSFVVCEMIYKSKCYISFDHGKKYEVEWTNNMINIGCSSMWIDVTQIDVF